MGDCTHIDEGRCELLDEAGTRLQDLLGPVCTVVLFWAAQPPREDPDWLKWKVAMRRAVAKVWWVMRRWEGPPAGVAEELRRLTDALGRIPPDGDLGYVMEVDSMESVCRELTERVGAERHYSAGMRRS